MAPPQHPEAPRVDVTLEQASFARTTLRGSEGSLPLSFNAEQDFFWKNRPISERAELPVQQHHFQIKGTVDVESIRQILIISVKLLSSGCALQ